MCKAHLNDTSTYTPVGQFDPVVVLQPLRSILIAANKRYVRNLGPSNQPLKETQLYQRLLYYMTHPGDCRISPFYCLPKLHKGQHPPPGRPIVSSIGSVTYAASQLVDHFLRPFINTLPTNCRSSNHAIARLELVKPRDDTIVLCADVVSLYPSIPTDAGVAAVKDYCFRFCGDSADRRNEVIFHMNVLEWVLKNNYLTFQSKTYRQINGTAMGTPCAVAYATLFLATIELPLLSSSSDTLLYYRYIDDICALTSLPAATAFVSRFNAAYPSIKLDAVTTDKTGVFLDLCITIQDDNKVLLQLYQKPSNKYQYIPPCSSHSTSVFANWILEELKRYSLRSTRKEDYQALVRAFTARLRARGYNSRMIARAVTQVPARATLTLSLPVVNPNPYIVSFVAPKQPRRQGPVLTLTLPGRYLHDLAPLVRAPLTLLTHPQYVGSYGEFKQVRVRLAVSKNIASFLTRSSFK